jgi:Family of unknown function (DUF6390)
VSGPELFARYAYPPNERGYCGPEDPAGLLAAGSPAADADVARRARRFEGAWVYLELIARAAGISDPLDARVVEAYWLGNDLLDGIDPGWFLAELRDRLRGQVSGQWASGVPDVGSGVVPHHAFHVFAIYPWVGLLHRDAVVARAILDQCRIRTGTVETVDGPRAQVALRPLSWDGRCLGTGDVETLDVRWSDHGRSLLAGVRVGDIVSIHWDWVCDVIDEARAAALADHELRQLAVTNRMLHGS